MDEQTGEEYLVEPLPVAEKRQSDLVAIEEEKEESEESDSSPVSFGAERDTHKIDKWSRQLEELRYKGPSLMTQENKVVPEA